MTRRRFEHLFGTASPFSPRTQTRLENSLGRALLGYKAGAVPLRQAVCRATRELDVAGLDANATLTLLGSLVESAGRSCGADRASLMSGEPVWMQVHSQVLDAARRELALIATPESHVLA